MKCLLFSPGLSKVVGLEHVRIIEIGLSTLQLGGRGIIILFTIIIIILSVFACCLVHATTLHS